MASSVVLLPPSRGKAPGGTGPGWRDAPAGRFAELDPDRRRVLRVLRRSSGISGLERAPTLPAIERYVGVLFSHLDAPTLPAAARNRLARDVVLLSGLWGLVAPSDLIPDYRLAMATRLEPLGRLSSWWRPRLSPLLDRRVAGAVVWDLLSGEYGAAWRSLEGTTYARRITPRVVEEVAAPDGAVARKALSHRAKAVRGALARQVLLHGLCDPDGIAELAPGVLLGHELDPAATVVEGPDVTVELVRRLER
ncbi:MAG: peroxide stress protein YaaA [Acidimicrobiales bacterium]